MKEFKGTKGKWEVKHSESKTAFNVVGTILGCRYKIARCPYIEDKLFSDVVNKLDKEEANAQLIATASELLEVVLNTKGALKDLKSIGTLPDTLDIIIDKLEIASNKALGKGADDE